MSITDARDAKAGQHAQASKQVRVPRAFTAEVVLFVRSLFSPRLHVSHAEIWTKIAGIAQRTVTVLVCQHHHALEQE